MNTTTDTNPQANAAPDGLEQYQAPFGRAWRRAISALLYVSYVVTFVLAPVMGAEAAPIADPHAPISFAPTITTSAGGVPVVNIAAPNAAGISLNQYQSFNVDAIGLILNNSLSAGSTLLGGAVGANPNLNGRSANVIVNQVTSNEPSTLSGAIEVFGNSASVVIANPNGITCNGCGTNNAPGFTLTTGTPIWQNSGATSAFAAATGIAYSVQNGTIYFAGQGLEGTRSRVDVVGAQIQVDAAVRGADQLNLIAGAQTVQGMPGDVVAAKPLTSSPQTGSYAINASSLGAITAGNINIIVSGAGFGVRSDASMAASSGSLNIAANGDVRVASLTSAGAMQISASGDIAATQITGAGDVTLNAGGSVTSTQHTESGASLTVQTGGDIRLSGTTLVGTNANLTSGHDTTLSGAVQVGSVGTSGNLTIHASGAATIGALTAVYGDVSATSVGDLETAGTLTANGQINLQSQRNIDLVGTVNAQGALNASASGSLSANAPLSSNGDMNLNAGGDLNTSPNATLYSAGAVNLNTAGSLNLGAGVGSVNGLNLHTAGNANLGSLNVTGDLGLTASGTISASDVTTSGSLALNATAGAVNITGPVQAGQDLNITASQNIAISGNAQAARNVSLTSGTDTQVSGNVTAGTGNFTAQSGGALAISGNVSAQGSASLSAAGALSLPGTLTVGQNASLQTSGDIVLSNSTTVVGDFSAIAGRDLLVSGALAVNGNINASAVRDITLPNGLNPGLGAQVSAGRNLTITGNATATGNLGLAAVNTLNVSGYTSATGNATLSAGLVQLPGSAYAAQDLSITQTSGTLNLPAVVNAGRDLVLNGDSVTTQGNALAGRDLAVTTNNGSYTANANVQAVRNATVNASNGVSLAQGASAGGTMTLNAGTGTLHSVGALTSVSDTTLSGQGIVLDANVASGGNASLSSTAGITTQAISAPGSITASASGNIAHQGDLNAGSAITLASTTGNIATQKLTSGADTAVTANGSITTQGNVSSGGALALTANQGSITANGAVAAATNVQANAGQDISVTGDLSANQALSATAGHSIHITGAATGLTAATLNAAQDIAVDGNLRSNSTVQATATNGNLTVGNGVAAGSTLGLTAGNDVQVTGTLQAAGNTTLAAGRDAGATGAVSVGSINNGVNTGDLSVTAGRNLSLAPTATVSVAGAATLNAQSGSATLGTTQTGGAANITAAQNITLGGVQSLQGITLLATNGSITSTADVNATTTLSETAGQDITHTGNTSAATGVTLNAGGSIVLGGNLASGTDITATAAQNFGATGSVSANGAIGLTATQGSVQAATIAALGNVGVTAGQNIATTGNITAGDPTATSATPANVQLQAGHDIQVGTLSTPGNLAATGNVNATAGNGLAVNGQAVTLGTLTASAGAGGIAITQGLTTNGDGNLTTTALGNFSVGQDAVFGANANLTIAGNTSIAGNFGVQTDLVYTGGSQAGGGGLAVGAATLVSGKTDVNTTGFSNLGGALYLQGSPTQWNSAGGITLGGTTYLTNNASLSASNGNIIANGDLYAAANLTLSALHDITLNGTTTVQGAANFSTAAGGAITGTGALNLAGDFTVTTPGDFITSNTLQVPGQLSITAANTSLTGTTSVIGNATLQNTGNLTLGGTFTTNGTLAAHAGNLTTSGTVMGVQSITLGGADLHNNGQLLTQGDISATFTNTANQNASGVMSGQNVGISATNAATLDGQVVASTQLTVTAPTLNTGGVVSAPVVTLNTSALTNSGAIQSPSLNIAGTGLTVNNSGTIYTTGSLNLTTASFSQTATGATQADTGISLTSNQIDNNGVLYTPGNLTIQNGGVLNNGLGATMVSATTTVTAGGGINNAGSIASTTGDLVVTSPQINNSGSMVSSNGQLTVHSSTSTDNSGLLASTGKLTIDGGGALTNSGNIGSGGTNQASDMSLTTGAITNSGIINASGKLTVSAGSVNNTSSQTFHGCVTLPGGGCDPRYTVSHAQISSGGDLNLTAASLDNAGVVFSGGVLTVNTTGDINNTPNPYESQSVSNGGATASNQHTSTGILSAVGDVNVTAGNITNKGVIASTGPAGNASASGNVTITTGNLTNSGQFGVIAGGAVEIDSTSLSNLNDITNAPLISATTGNVVLLGGGGAFNNSGGIQSSTENVLISGYQSVTNTDPNNNATTVNLATILAPHDSVIISTTGAINNGNGHIQSHGDITLTGASYSSTSGLGLVYSEAANIALNASGALDVNSINSLATNSGHSVSLSGNDINVGSGAWTAYGNVYNAGNINVEQGGKVVIANAGNLSSTSLNNIGGDVGVGGNLTTGAIVNHAVGTVLTAQEDVPGNTNLDAYYANYLVSGSTALGICPFAATSCTVNRDYFQVGSVAAQLVVGGNISFSSIDNYASYIYAGGGVTATSTDGNSGSVNNQSVHLNIGWYSNGLPNSQLTGQTTQNASSPYVGGQAIIQIGGRFVASGLTNAGVISVGGNATISGNSINGVTDPQVQTVQGSSNASTSNASASTTSTSSTTAPSHTLVINGVTYTYLPAPTVPCSANNPCEPTVGTYVDANGHPLPTPLDPSPTGPNSQTCGNGESGACVPARIAANPSYNAYNTVPGSTVGVSSGLTQGPVGSDISPLQSNLPTYGASATAPPSVSLSAWQPGKGVIDTSAFAGVTSGTLNVGGKLTLDGGNFTNTGFVNADTIELNNVDLINAQRLAAVDSSNFIAVDHWSQTTGYATQAGGVMNANNWIINDVKLDANGNFIQPSVTHPSADGDDITTAYYDPADRTGSINCVGNCTFGVNNGLEGQDTALKDTLASASGVTYSSTALDDMLHTISQSPPLPWYETGVVGVVALIVTFIVNFFCDGCLTTFLMTEMHVSFEVAFAMATAISKGLIQIASGANVEDTMVSTFLAVAMAEFGSLAAKTLPLPTGSAFTSVLERNLIMGAFNSVFLGHSLDLGSILGKAFTSTVLQEGAMAIGDLANDGVAATPESDAIPPTITPFEQLLLHAGLGCLGGAAMAGNMSGCAPGGAGAVAGELTAQTVMNQGAESLTTDVTNADGTTTPKTPEQIAADRDALSTKALNYANFASSVAGFAASGGTQQGADIGAATGGNAAANNFLVHAQATAMQSDIASCNGKSGGCTEDEMKTIVSTYMDMSNANIGIVNQCILTGNTACILQMQRDAATPTEVTVAGVGGQLDFLAQRAARETSGSITGDTAHSDLYKAQLIDNWRQSNCAGLSTTQCDQAVLVVLKQETITGWKLLAGALALVAVPTAAGGVTYMVVNGAKWLATQVTTLGQVGPVLYCAMQREVCLGLVEGGASLATGTAAPSALPLLPVSPAKQAAAALGNDAKVITAAENSASVVTSGANASGAAASLEPPASLVQQVADLRATLPSGPKTSGNMGVAQIDVPGVQPTMAASSQIQAPTAAQAANGFVGQVPETFPSSVVPTGGANPVQLLRNVDSEAKILNNVAAQLGDNTSVSGTINLITERAPCASCSNVIDAFRARYPNITLNVFDNNGVLIPPTKKVP